MSDKQHNQFPVEVIRHSTAHLLAAALERLYPGIQFGVGPVVEHGFYYDVLSPTPISSSDFSRIEKEMARLRKQNIPYERLEVPIAEAKQIMRERGQTFKIELLDDIEKYGTTNVVDMQEGSLASDGKDSTVSLYKTGDFIDLCRGPHIDHSGQIGACKLRAIAGAYWRGKENNPQLTRIYGYAFMTQDELDSLVSMMAEAEKRDHRKLGKELGLFTIVDEVGQGLPLFYPKGALLRRSIEDLIIDMQEKRGYVPIWIPHITKESLYKISGHLEKYDALFAPLIIDDDHYYLKPMNCPHFMMLFNSLPHSYRDLPLRYTATTTVYRNEKSGELSGLTRVRSITQDDCHVFCSADQIEKEISMMLEMIKDIYSIFQLKEYRVRISVHDPAQREKYIGSDEYWETAESALKEVVHSSDIPSEIGIGEAAFYGPKLDFLVKDAIGREWQMSTIQLDYNLPGRFKCEYVGPDGLKQQPIVIHRAILGSTERFLGIIIEHFAGAFPLWLSPVQVVVLPVGLTHVGAAQSLVEIFGTRGIRTELDDSNESVGYKIRKAEKSKVPYMVVVGDKEIDLLQVSVRKRGNRDIESLPLEEFIGNLLEEIIEKK